MTPLPDTSSTEIDNSTYDELLSRIGNRTARVGVVGLGYVGLPLSMLFAQSGFAVTGFDVDSDKVSALTAGKSYFVRIREEDVQSARHLGFTATTDFAHIRTMDAIIICVPTPLNEHREPDLSYVTSTAASIAPYLRRGQLIVLESTTYPGTTDEVLIPLLNSGNPESLRAESSDRIHNPGFFVAFSPEREDPGNDSIERCKIPKVIGSDGKASLRLACALYGSIFERTVPVSSYAAAEMTKLLENIYRCVNIALVNELKQLCARMDIDIFEVIDAARTKPFGFHAFYPGPGLGGHCIPIDPFYLSWKAKQYEFQTRFIELAGEVNTSMPYYVVEKTSEALNERCKAVRGSKVLILGIAYKKDVDDLRESPAITIIELLRKRGAQVCYHDPYFTYVGKGRRYDLNMSCVPLSDLSNYDCVLIVTDHSIYDLHRIVEDAQLVVDTRNATKGIDSSKIVRC